MCALDCLLKKSEMYRLSGIQINDDWISEITEMNRMESTEVTRNENCEIPQDLNDQDDDSDHFSEVDEADLHVGNTDTLLDEILDESDQIADKEYVCTRRGSAFSRIVILMLNIWHFLQYIVARSELITKKEVFLSITATLLNGN